MKLRRKNIPSNFGKLSRPSALKFTGGGGTDEGTVISEDDKQIISQRVSQVNQFMGGGNFENEEQKLWYQNQIKERINSGMSTEDAIADYRNTFKVGEEETTTVVEQKVDTKDQKNVSTETVDDKKEFWHYVDELGEDEFFSSLANNINAIDRWKKMRDDKNRGYSSSSNMYARGTNARFIPRRSGFTVGEGMIDMYKNNPDKLKEILINNYPEVLGINSGDIKNIENVDLVPGKQGTWEVISKETTKK